MKAKNLDQFYTSEATARECISFLKQDYNLDEYFLLEPSAGTGAFSSQFHDNSLALDIDPKRDNIRQQDFLQFDHTSLLGKRVFTIGNPPFGRNASLAIKFFNKAAKFSEYIAFIVPKTFKKIGTINKLDSWFHLVKDLDIPLESFVFQGEPYAVPCVFQVYEKRDVARDKIEQKKESRHFYFTDREGADFAIRRVGGLAGKVIEDFSGYKDPSHYFIKAAGSKKQLIEQLQDIYKKLNDAAKNSAGNPSLSKHELITIYEESIAKKESQGHGFLFEEQIKRRVGEFVMDCPVSYTSKWDIPPVSVKSFKFDKESFNNRIYFGSIENIFSIKDGFFLAIVGYEQQDGVKSVVLSDFVYISASKWQEIKGPLSVSEIRELDKKLKTFGPGEHEEARKWYKSVLPQYAHKTAFQINFKVDSKGQRRIQCSITVERLYELLEADLYIDNKLCIEDISSSARKRASLSEKSGAKIHKRQLSLLDFC